MYKVVGYQPASEFAKSLTRASTLRSDLNRFGALLQKNPKDFAALTGLASVHASTGEVDTAAALLKRAEAAARPSDLHALLQAYNDVGDGYQNGGQPLKAIPLFRKAIDPKFPAQTAYARMSIAVCYFAANQPKEAIPFLEAYLAMGKEADEYRAQARQMLSTAKGG